MNDLALNFIKWLNETFQININQDQGEFLIGILLAAWPMWLFLVYLFLSTCRDFIRFFIPTKKEKQAMKIATEIADDIMRIDEKFSLWNDKQKVIDSYLSKLTFKENTNKNKIKILNDGIKKLGLFSKKKKEKIKTRIAVLEDANITIESQKIALRKISSQMDCFCKLKKANVGEVVEFGKCKWFVMKKNEKHLLLLSKCVIDVSWNRNGWAEGGLRYLCDVFYKNLEAHEKKIIRSVNRKTQNENVVTKDNVFILSPEDVASLSDFTWTHIDESLPAKISSDNTINIEVISDSWKVAPWTRDADNRLKNAIYDYSEGGDGHLVKHFKEVNYDKGWWLRSSENEKLYIDGKGIFHNNPHLEICGFRPAVWIEIQ